MPSHSRRPLIRASLLAVSVSLFGVLSIFSTRDFLVHQFVSAANGQPTSNFASDIAVFLLLAGEAALSPGIAFTMVLFGRGTVEAHAVFVPMFATVLYFLVFFWALRARELRRAGFSGRMRMGTKQAGETPRTT
jgi:hypothetical protein